MSSHKITLAHVFFVIAAVIALLPSTSSSVALMLGIGVALFFGNPFLGRIKKVTPLLLQLSIVGMGAGMSLDVIGRAGEQGIVYTITGITFTMGAGLLLGRMLSTSRDTSLLVTVGTAICGGSAIAAAAPAIRAKSHEVSVALAIVFILNAVALVLFPWIGHHFALTEIQFGLWSALAIHDTSSVVGASLQYGPRALEIATTVKLARALWIIPVTFILALTWKSGADRQAAGKAKRPWFILGFVLAAALVTWVPALQEAGRLVASGSRRALVFTLFLIGSGLTRAALKTVGVKPFIQGFFLWVLVASGTLAAIFAGWIK